MTAWLPVAAVDPGGTTGICALRVLAGDLASIDSKTFYGGIEFLVYDQWPEPAAPEAVMNTVLSIACSYEGRFPLVIEDFSLREFSRDRNLLSPVRVGERIQERLAGSPLAGCCGHVVMQTPSEALGTVTDERLKRWGLYRRGQPHARDALRHAVHLLRRARASEALRKEWWGQ